MSINEHIDDNQELDKQRRNIMVTATIIVLIWFVGIKVTNINLGVTGLTFQNSERLFYLLEIALGYFLFRYIVLFMKKKSIKDPLIKNTLHDEILNTILAKHIEFINDENIIKRIKIEIWFHLDKQYATSSDFIYSLKIKNVTETRIQRIEIKADEIGIIYRNILKQEIWSASGLMHYIFPIVFAMMTLIVTGYKLEPKENVITSFKDHNTSIQIKELCSNNYNSRSLEYKICVKEIEKKLYKK